MTLYTLLPRVLHWFIDAKRQHLSTINTDSDLSFTTIKQQTYRRKQLMDQADDNSLTQGRSQTFSFGGATGGASFATRGAVDGLCRTFRKRPTERDLILWGPLGGSGKILGGQWPSLAPP